MDDEAPFESTARKSLAKRFETVTINDVKSLAESLGAEFHVHHATHWQVRNSGTIIDYWPTTGRISISTKDGSARVSRSNGNLAVLMQDIKTYIIKPDAAKMMRLAKKNEELTASFKDDVEFLEWCCLLRTMRFFSEESSSFAQDCIDKMSKWLDDNVPTGY